jgi:glycosyltransferase involved in cell wall biosynthesis
MRIAHVSVGALPAVFSEFGGAIQRRVGELAREQVRRGHDVVVLSPGAEWCTRNVDGVEVWYLRCRTPAPFAHIEFQLRVLITLMRRRRRLDVIHVHSEPELALPARLLARKVALSYDNYFFRGGRGTPLLYRLYRLLLRRFDLLLPCSDYCRMASARYWQLPPERLTVSYNGVNVEEFRPDAAAGRSEREVLDLSGPILLYVGRICSQKGTDTLLDAYRELRARWQDVKLVLVGPFEQFGARGCGAEDLWRQRIETAGALHLGVVDDWRLPALYNAADVFVMPTAELEMFGMAVVEALACGTPVVASDHGGLKETAPECCGARFRPRDSGALATAILDLLGDDMRRAACAEAAREHALRFAWPRVAAELDPVYADGL